MVNPIICCIFVPMAYNEFIRYNRELEVINDQDKAYLLGLFYSDGNVYLRPNDLGGLSRIGLHTNDRELLEDIKAVFPFFNIYESSNREVSTLLCGKMQCALDLIDNGCHPAKSFRNKDILLVPNLEDHLCRHFVRGVFDGDGGCTLSLSHRKVQKRVYIYSNSIGFLEGLVELLGRNNIVSKIDSWLPKGSGFTEGCVTTMMHKLSVSTISYQTFYNFLYEDCNLFMKRKVEKFDEILKTNFFVKKQTPLCPKCGASNTVSSGRYKYREGWYNILCRGCGKISVCPLP